LFDVDQTDVMLTLCTNFSKAIEVVDDEQKPELAPLSSRRQFETWREAQ
jgi:hypothetical protein